MKILIPSLTVALVGAILGFAVASLIDSEVVSDANARTTAADQRYEELYQNSLKLSTHADELIAQDKRLEAADGELKAANARLMKAADRLEVACFGGRR